MVVWQHWTGGGTGTSSTVNSSTWGYWVTGSTNTTSTMMADVWYSWTSTSYTTGGIAWASPPVPTPLTEAQLRQRRRLDGIRHAKRRSAELARQAADVKARALLLSILDADQRAELEAKAEITVHTRTGRRFCLDARKRAHNAYELDADGNRIAEYCIVPRAAHIPQDDHLAAQVLMLSLEEEEFDRIANTWRLEGAARHRGGHRVA